MTSCLVRSRFRDQIFDVLYEVQLGIDTLIGQVISVCCEFSGFSEVEIPILIDIFGRPILSNDDFDDCRRVLMKEVSSNESLVDLGTSAHMFSSQSDNNHSKDDTSWEHIIDIESTTQTSEGSGSSGMVRATLVLDVWVVDGSSVMNTQCCVDDLIDSNYCPVVQRKSRLIDTDMTLCLHCQQSCDSSLLQSDVAVYSTSKKCQGKLGRDMGLLAPLVLDDSYEKLCKLQSSLLACTPVLLYTKRKLYDDVLTWLPSTLDPTVIRDFQSRLASGRQTIMVYEDNEQQQKARSVIDYAKVREYSYAKLQSGGDEDSAFLHGLMQWFKCDFFTWCNKPPCNTPDCNAPPGEMDAVCTQAPNETELNEGWASRTEVYKCRRCANETRFPRYNNPSKLLETRRGRCGEWANAFCLLCRALALDARWVLDFTDHVWIEVWVPSQGRFVHIDPCERAMDTPLLYEKGWGKKLTHIISFSRYGVVDATTRYTRHFEEILHRRGIATEAVFSKLISECDKNQENGYIIRRGTKPTTLINSWSSLHLDALDGGAIRFAELAQQDISTIVMARRRRQCSRELNAHMFIKTDEWKLEEMQGRISGDETWRRARGELGT